MELTRLVTALAVTAALTLAGCSDDPEPKLAPSPDPSRSTSTSGTPEPAESPSPTPAPLDPEETVRAWIDARNVLMLEGDSSAVKLLSATGCETCQDSIDPLLQVHADGGRFDNNGWRVSSTKLRSSSEQRATVSAAIVTSPGTTTPSQGATPVTYGRQRRIAMFRLKSHDESWRVAFIGYLS